MDLGGIVFIIIFVIFFLPFFVWLTMEYIRFGGGDKKRKVIYFGFLLSFGVMDIIGGALRLNEAILLTVGTVAFLFFTIFMLNVVLKDKKKTKQEDEFKRNLAHR